ncbi:helix-turn-helix domain-containing protein [Erwinia aphidicola]|uniref:helix-turn-helix domain-containing protein n=1 Tax=Erwinia aphidicola TaxID=68334 RepID=UPI0016545AFB
MRTMTLNASQLDSLIASLPLLLQTAAAQLEPLSVLVRACTLPVENEADLQGRMALIDELYSHATDVEHFAAQCAERVSDRVYEYEMKQLQVPNVTPGEALSMLMKARKIRQADLRQIATQSVISEVIHGKRSLTVEQIKALARFFRVPLETFMGQP